jgi:alkylation response protein AidB-like acyl-CoA dehydrogenase
MSACSKLVASEVAMKVTTDALQIAGGYGYMTDFPFERMIREPRLHRPMRALIRFKRW